MAFQKGVSIMKHVTQQEYIITISPLENAFIAQYSSIYGTLATMTSHYLYATLQTHLTNVKTYSLCIITDTFRHVHFCIKQVETRFKNKNDVTTDQSKDRKMMTCYY